MTDHRPAGAGAALPGGMDAAAMRELVTLLAGLRRAGRQQSGLDPRLVPPDKAAAYHAAAMTAEELGWPVIGWKIAAMKEEIQQALRTGSPIYGPVYGPFLQQSPYTAERAALASPILEAEYQAKLGSDLPPREEPYSVAEVTAAVASLHPGIELAECRFAHDDAFPPLTAILADGAGSGTIIPGPAISGWQRHDVASQEVTLLVNGRARRHGTAADALDHPMVAVAWLANELSCRGIGLWAGQWISTGTVTGMLAARQGGTFTADFGPLGSATLTLT